MTYRLIVLLCLVFAGPALADNHEPPDFDPRARQIPTPVITKLDDDIDGGTWVTMVYTLNNAEAKQFVPILRPLLPQNAHLVAHPASRTLVMCDSYANVERIIRIVQIIDKATPRQSRG